MSNQFSIQNLLAEKLSAGINFYFGMAGCHADLLGEFIDQQVAAIRSTHLQSLPPGFAHSRQLFNSLRIDPTKHRPSSEALWRKLRDKNSFPAINPPVDLTNLLSLKFQVCYGLYDLQKILGPVVITVGHEGDQYQGIRKEELNFNGKIVLRDARGAFGNPSADSLRACVTENSLNIMQVLFFNPHDIIKEKFLAETLATFKRFFKINTVQSFLLTTNDKQGITPKGEACKTSA